MRTLILAAILIISSCKKNEDKAKEQAAQAQKEANDKAEAAAKAQREADEKTAAAKREADAAASKAAADARDKIQKDFDAADRKLTYLKDKVAKAKGAKRKNADAALAEAELRSASVKTSLAGLEKAAANDLEAARAKAQSDVEALNKAVDAVETTLK